MMGVPRRRPVQARAEKRRASLLDAAATILARDGYEGLNTNALAKEAHAAVGTVYDYFPNKQAVLLALLERYRKRLEAALLPTLAEAAQGDLDTLIEGGVRAFADFYRDEPGYAELWLGTQLVGPLRDAGDAWGDGFGDMLGAVFRHRLNLSPSRAKTVAQTFVHAVSAVVSLAQTRSGRQRERLVDEAVALGQRYLRALD